MLTNCLSLFNHFMGLALKGLSASFSKHTVYQKNFQAILVILLHSFAWPQQNLDAKNKTLTVYNLDAELNEFTPSSCKQLEVTQELLKLVSA